MNADLKLSSTYVCNTYIYACVLHICKCIICTHLVCTVFNVIEHIIVCSLVRTFKYVCTYVGIFVHKVRKYVFTYW